MGIVPTMKQVKSQIPIPQAVAACTAFAAFSVSILVGLAAENPSDTVLSRALIAMALGFGGGFMIGMICEWIVEQEIMRVESRLETEAAASAASEVSSIAEVGLDGLTGVDVIEEEPAVMAGQVAQSEDRGMQSRR
jgi:hypothetical protein